GEVMNVGGLSKRIIDLAMALVGHIRGGLGYVTIVAACILSALSGSAVADAAALSALLVPMMVAAGHDRKKAGGLVAAAGVIGPVIPPSIGFVIFGVAANLSITKLFLAGIMPGIYIAAGLWFAWWWEVRKEKLAPPAKSSLADVMRALRSASWALVLPFIIIFGLKFGIFTPTEAAVKAAGIDPIYFGVLFIVNNSIGLITPPVGVVLNVVAGVSKISMEDVMRGVWPFMLAETAVLLLMVVFPPLVTIPAKWFAG